LLIFSADQRGKIEKVKNDSDFAANISPTTF
jgi:hypothetical protein